MGFKSRRTEPPYPAPHKLSPALRQVYDLLPASGRPITIVEIMEWLPGSTRAAVWQRIKELIARKMAYRTNGTGPGFIGKYARLNRTE